LEKESPPWNYTSDASSTMSTFAWQTLARSKLFLPCAALVPARPRSDLDTEHYFTADELFVSGGRRLPCQAKSTCIPSEIGLRWSKAFHAADSPPGASITAIPAARPTTPAITARFVRDPDWQIISKAGFTPQNTRSGKCFGHGGCGRI